MMLHNKYLTDEELEALILEVETDEIVPAPPGMEEKICRAIFNDNCENDTEVRAKVAEGNIVIVNPPPEHANKKHNRQKDFVGYCIRVVISAAAAIAFIFILPYLPGYEVLQEEPAVQPTDAREQVLEHIYEEYVPQSEFRQEYPTKEEVLKEPDLIGEPFIDSDFIKENSYLDFFKKENGGQK